MDELLKKLKDYRRWLELEDSLPRWENQRREYNARILEMTESLQRKENELKALPPSKVFLGFFGRTEAKKEKHRRQIQEILSARTAAQWELELLNQRIASGQEEIKTLSGSRSAYEAAKAGRILTPAQESCLMMEEISAFAPAAQEAAGSVLELLDVAGMWEDQNKRNDAAWLQEIEVTVNHLYAILTLLPEGIAPVGRFLENPPSVLQENNGLHEAREQVQRIINQLKMLLGE